MTVFIPNNVRSPLTSAYFHSQIPYGCRNFHHEVELAVVIGATCRETPEADVMKNVAGYALSLDMTARDFQEKVLLISFPFVHSFLIFIQSFLSLYHYTCTKHVAIDQALQCVTFRIDQARHAVSTPDWLNIS